MCTHAYMYAHLQILTTGPSCPCGPANPGRPALPYMRSHELTLIYSYTNICTVCVLTNIHTYI